MSDPACLKGYESETHSEGCSRKFFNTVKAGTMYNASMVFYFVDNYVRRNGNVPKYMLDDNIRTDYNKLRMLVHRDNEFGHDASIIGRIAEQGYCRVQVCQGQGYGQSCRTAPSGSYCPGQ